MFGLCFYVSNLAMDILVFIVFYFMDSTLWFIVIAIWSTDHKVVLNLTWLAILTSLGRIAAPARCGILPQTVSVCLSVNDHNPCKTAEPIEMPFRMWIWVGLRNYVIDWVQIPPREGELLRRNDVGISPHAVDQRFDWPATEAFECHTNFSQWKIPLRCGLWSKFFDYSLG